MRESIILPSLACLVVLAIGCSPRGQPIVGKNPGERNKIEKLVYETPKSFANKDYEVFPTALIKLVRPDGFSLAECFVGFCDGANDASVMLNVSPMPFKKELREQIFATLSLSNIDEVYTKDVEISGRKGIYINAQKDVETNEKSKVSFGKHMLAFGDDKYSWVITGSFPLDQEDELSKKILTSVLSARPIDGEMRAHGQDVDFTIDEPENLTFNRGWAKKYVLTKNGKFPIENISDPFVRFGKTPNPYAVPAQARPEFARKQLLVTPLIEVNLVSSETKTTVDGLEGYEILAVGNEVSTMTPMILYVGVLFNGSDFYTMNAWYGSDNVDTDYLEDFKTIFRSFKRK